MRRFVSIAMVLLFWLGPLSALVPGSDESQLPACCRRHGVHHCTMSQDEVSGANHSVTAPATCPQYHRAAPATMAAFVLPPVPVAEAERATRVALAAVQLETLQHARTSADRGPPARV
jgi:hypothetical protein